MIWIKASRFDNDSYVVKDSFGTDNILHIDKENVREDEAMKINVVLEEGAKMPTKAHDTDAGFDLYAPKDIKVCGGNHAFIDTGVHMAIPKGYVGMIKSKSGLNVNHNLNTEGVIDAGYTGKIGVKVYNHGREDYNFKAGDKLTQIVIMPIPEVELEVADSLEDTERGNGGFGSSGK